MKLGLGLGFGVGTWVGIGQGHGTTFIGEIEVVLLVILAYPVRTPHLGGGAQFPKPRMKKRSESHRFPDP